MLEGLGLLLCPPGIPFSPCNLLFSVERLADLGSVLPRAGDPLGNEQNGESSQPEATLPGWLGGQPDPLLD